MIAQIVKKICLTPVFINPLPEGFSEEQSAQKSKYIQTATLTFKKIPQSTWATDTLQSFVSDSTPTRACFHAWECKNQNGPFSPSWVKQKQIRPNSSESGLLILNPASSFSQNVNKACLALALASSMSSRASHPGGNARGDAATGSKGGCGRYSTARVISTMRGSRCSTSIVLGTTARARSAI